MISYTDNSGERRRGDGQEVVCVWCGEVIRGGASKAAQRMCQPCFARMMREHLERTHRSHGALPRASER